MRTFYKDRCRVTLFATFGSFVARPLEQLDSPVSAIWKHTDFCFVASCILFCMTVLRNTEDISRTIDCLQATFDTVIDLACSDAHFQLQ